MTNFNITSMENEASVRLALGEDLVASIVPDVRAEMKRLITHGILTLLVDMQSVRIVDSSGIGCLIAAHNSLNARAGRLVVENVSNDLYELFTSMRLDRHFEILRSA